MGLVLNILVFVLPIFLFILAAIAGYAYTQIRTLSLPLPEALAFFTVLYPLITGVSSLALPRLLYSSSSSSSNSPSSPLRGLTPTLLLRLLTTLLIIYGTVLATLSIFYITPSDVLSCGLDVQWGRLFSARNAFAIRAIQQEFECCGFNTVRDRAWPFQSQSVDAGECVRRFGWEVPCSRAWGKAERVYAAMLLGVVVVVAVVLFTTILMITREEFGAEAGDSSTSWIRVFQPPASRVRRSITHPRLIEGCEGDDSVTGNEHYRDEEEGGPADAAAAQGGGTSAADGDESRAQNNGGAGGVGNKPRVEPSNLMAPNVGGGTGEENGAQWR